MAYIYEIPYTAVSVWPLPMAMRSKAWVCGRSFVGIAGSNAAGARSVVSVLCVVRYKSIRRAHPSSRGVLPCVCVIKCDQMQQQPSTPTVSRYREVWLSKRERK